MTRTTMTGAITAAAAAAGVAVLWLSCGAEDATESSGASLRANSMPPGSGETLNLTRCPPGGIAADEYAVLGVAIDRLFTEGASRLVVAGTTGPAAEPASFRWEFPPPTSLPPDVAAVFLPPEPGQNLPPPLAAALADYSTRNGARACVDARFKLAVPYQVVPQRDLERIFGAGNAPGEHPIVRPLTPGNDIGEPPAPDSSLGWNAFARAYPGAAGIVTITRPGFDQTKTVAVVSLTHVSGALAGRGVWAVLARAPGAGWQLVTTTVIWIA